MSNSAGGSNPSPIKPHVTTGMIMPLLLEYFDRPVLSLEEVKETNLETTFSFAVGSDDRDKKDYLIRFNPPMLVNFEKEAYCYNKFASPTIPIPPVVHFGRLDEIHFVINEKLPGKSLVQIPRSEYLALIPQQMEILEAIHQIPVRDTTGYGVFDGNGIAPERSWKERLQMINAEDPDGDFYGKWHALFETTFLERELFDFIYNKMITLSQYCPEERYLVQGGYGFSKILAQDGKITAILAWMDAQYGDFLYDVASLDFGFAGDHWRERFQQYYQQIGRAVPHYNERLLCYQCFKTLDAMKFYAKAGSLEGYAWIKDRMSSLLGDEAIGRRG